MPKANPFDGRSNELALISRLWFVIPAGLGIISALMFDFEIKAPEGLGSIANFFVVLFAGLLAAWFILVGLLLSNGRLNIPLQRSMLRVQYEALTVILFSALIMAIFAGAEYKASDFVIEFIVVAGSATIFISLWLWMKLVEFFLNNIESEPRTKDRDSKPSARGLPDTNDQSVQGALPGERVNDTVISGGPARAALREQGRKD